MESGTLKHYRRRDILTAFGIANNEGHGHQLPSKQIIDRYVASQVPVVEALTCVALNQDNGDFGIVHAKTSGTVGPTPVHEKDTRRHGLATTRGDPAFTLRVCPDVYWEGSVRWRAY